MNKTFTSSRLKGLLLCLISLCITSATMAQSTVTLPFTFDKGVKDLPAGCTQVGLGSDYSSSPKLKFDTTNDNLVIAFGEAPKTLSFDIKWNQSSNGFTNTFTIEESADETDYTALEVINAENPLKNGEKVSREYELKSTSRFVRFYFTNKTNGNIALGKIEITAASVNALSAPTFQHFDLGYGYNNTDPFFLAKAVEITNANEKGNVYYTIDGSEPTAESTLYNFEANGPISFEETTTLKAIVIDGDKKSSVTSATYTAFPMENVFMSVADIKAKGTSATDFIAFAPNSFYYLFGGANNHYISDGENNILVYGSNIFPENVAVGASLTGAIMGHYENYYGLTEITDVQVVKNLIESEFDDPISVTPSELTASEIISNYATHEHKLVTVKGIKAAANGTFSTSSASNISFAEGDKNIVVRNNFKTLTSEIKKDGVYNITGFVASNETKEGVTNYQIFPRTNADIVETSETGITETIATNLTVTTTKGAAVIAANEATSVNIYGIAGQLVKTLTAQAGTTVVELPAGVYVIAGIKVVIL